MFAMIVVYGISAILTATDVLASDPQHIQYRARTDAKISVLTNAPWFRFPYPGFYCVFVTLKLLHVTRRHSI